MKAFMMSLILMPRKRNSDWQRMMTTAQVNQKKRVKVSIYCLLFSRYSTPRSAIPPRTPSKKHDEESVSSKREEHSPILKKATAVSIQSRSKINYI